MKHSDDTGKFIAETTLFPEFDVQGTEEGTLFRSPEPVNVRFEADPAEISAAFAASEETAIPAETGADARLLAERAEQISSKLETGADAQMIQEIQETAGRMEEILEDIRELMAVFEKEFWT